MCNLYIRCRSHRRNEFFSHIVCMSLDCPWGKRGRKSRANYSRQRCRTFLHTTQQRSSATSKPWQQCYEYEYRENRVAVKRVQTPNWKTRVLDVSFKESWWPDDMRLTFWRRNYFFFNFSTSCI
jgi:hypothetical protein